MSPNANSQWKDAEPGEPEFLAAMKRSGRCPHPDVLLASRSGAMGAEAEQRALQHLEQCANCAAFLHDLEDPEIAALRPEEQTRISNVVFAAFGKQAVEKQQEPAPAPRRSRLWFAIPVLAAAAAVVVVVVASRPDPAPTPVAKIPEQPQQVLLALAKPPIQVPAEVLIFRGNENPAAGYAQELALALAPYRSDDFARAATLLEPVARKYPKNPEAPFYLGVSLLFLNRPAEALPWLETAKTNLTADRVSGAVVTDAAWYLAVGLQRAGDTQRAAAELATVCAKSGPHQAEACAAK